ncbi:transglycosylase domain-containing protein [Selenomonas sp. F0473]|uniref:transglycosylase domain-containing protein n=1 Tax=Selenomonas sp. F0473 TaxID=999423 RepID=UPI0025DA673B|nr:penicillin-binding protein 1A [Selenomonas sp. F0473]
MQKHPDKNEPIKKRTEKGRSKKSTTGSIIGKTILVIGLILFVMVIGVGCGFLTASLNTKPNLAEDIVPPASSQIYDINGNEIANIHATENRMPVSINDIPKNLQNAFVAVEDNRFYDHAGIDPRGILRAIWANIRGRTVTEGGSTITQQLAKNAYLTQDRTLKRKIQEVFLALQLERQYTKQEILELYLNQIYFGQGAYGVQAAARTYFGKDVKDLTLNECAMLAGIPKSPNYYSPSNNLDAAMQRKAVVLDQMAKYGYISDSEANTAKKEELAIVKTSNDGVKVASYFVDYVLQILVEKYGDDAIYKDGLKIYTTIDMDMQAAAEAAMQNLPNYYTDANGILQPQGALVAIDPHNGYIKAMVGGRGTDQFNRATQAVRQPGSAFKPFVFAAALENNYTPDSVIEDKPLKVGGWEPQNYSRKFSGKVHLRDVVRWSLNVPTVRIAQDIGIDKAIFYAQEMGISTFVLDGATNDRNLATALGGMTRGVTPLELTSAFGTFANRGIHVEPVAIVRVVSRTGKVLEEADRREKSVMSAANAATMTNMLSDVIRSGTGTGANIGRPAAGKTGTTSDYHDAWFVGYTPDLVAGVWIGNDSVSDLHGMSGGTTPAVIWREFMIKAHTGLPVRSFEGSVSYKPASELDDLDDSDKDEEDKDTAEKKEKGQEKRSKTKGANKTSSENAGTSSKTKSTPADSGNVPERGAGVEKGRN